MNYLVSKGFDLDNALSMDDKYRISACIIQRQFNGEDVNLDEVIGR